MFEHLFAPIKIRDMELKNRIILPAMGTRMAAENGAVTDTYHTLVNPGRPIPEHITELMRTEYCRSSRRTYAKCAGAFCIYQ